MQARRLVPVVLGALLLMVSVAGPGRAAETVMGPAPQRVEDRWILKPPGIRVETWAAGLKAPWALAFLPDGRALVTERRGVIRLIEKGGGGGPLGQLKVVEDDESGLMGLAVHPGFPDPPYIYVMVTSRAGGQGVRNLVIRFPLEGGKLGRGLVMIEDIPAGGNHNGGRLAFGPDGMLYVGTGDIWQRHLAQDRNSLAGKILRVTPDGQVPGDNPFPGSPIWSFGHRNVQGLAWHPETGEFYASEHGPSGEVGFGAFDEINLIVKGGNYGWPLAVGAPGRAGWRDPVVAWPEVTTPPSGAAFWRGDLYVATLGSEALVRIRLHNGRALGIERWFNDGDRSAYGRLRDAVRGPDGALYVLTGTHDWRGDQRPGDDRVLRITPAK
jgi:quinoprotein glucose dehydrogenase